VLHWGHVVLEGVGEVIAVAKQQQQQQSLVELHGVGEVNNNNKESCHKQQQQH